MPNGIPHIRVRIDRIPSGLFVSVAPVYALAKSTGELNLSGEGGLNRAKYPAVDGAPHPAMSSDKLIKKTIDMKEEIFFI